MMKKNNYVKKQPSKTNWSKVANQTDSQVIQNANEDPDSPILKNKKYYKPEKNGK